MPAILKMNFNFNYKDKLRAAGQSIRTVTTALDLHHTANSRIERQINTGKRAPGRRLG